MPVSRALRLCGGVEYLGNIHASMDSVGAGGSLSRAIDCQAGYMNSESSNKKQAGFRVHSTSERLLMLQYDMKWSSQDASKRTSIYVDENG